MQWERKWVVQMMAMEMACREAEGKPRIAILATGGTIAGRADKVSATTGYKAGAIGVDVLLDAVPEIGEYASVMGEQISNIDSRDMTDWIWLKLAKRVNELLSTGNVDGIVITHGTDTLEETAYFLNLTVKSEKPVVLVGAMRPATAISADGPMNLLNGVRVAVSRESAGKGVLVVMNDEINAAREVTKTNTINVGTFKTPELGFLGYVNNGIPEFYRQSTRRHTKNSEFDSSGLSELPYVKVIYGHANDDSLFVEAAMKAGVKGIIYAGMGNGSISAEVEKILAKATSKGIVVIRSSRGGNGTVIPAEQSYIDDHFLDGDTLSPQKARILLQLALTRTSDLQLIQKMFKEY